MPLMSNKARVVYLLWNMINVVVQWHANLVGRVTTNSRVMRRHWGEHPHLNNVTCTAWMLMLTEYKRWEQVQGQHWDHGGFKVLTLSLGFQWDLAVGDTMKLLMETISTITATLLQVLHVLLS